MSEQTELLAMSLRCDPAAPAAVRGSMASLRGLGWTLEDAILIASELVTSAVTHCGHDREQWIDVKVSRTRRQITIVVTGPGGSSGAAIAADEVALDPLGTTIMDELAESWGRTPGDCYRVWAELTLPGRA